MKVPRRITAIEAICDGEIENLLSRLRLLRSCLNKEQMKTPVLQFWRENLPNLSVSNKESDGTFEPEWKEKFSGFPSINASGTNVFASCYTTSSGSSQMQIPGSVNYYRPLTVGNLSRSFGLSLQNSEICFLGISLASSLKLHILGTRHFSNSWGHNCQAGSINYGAQIILDFPSAEGCSCQFMALPLVCLGKRTWRLYTSLVIVPMAPLCRIFMSISG